MRLVLLRVADNELEFVAGDFDQKQLLTLEANLEPGTYQLFLEVCFPFDLHAKIKQEPKIEAYFEKATLKFFGNEVPSALYSKKVPDLYRYQKQIMKEVALSIKE